MGHPYLVQIGIDSDTIAFLEAGQQVILVDIEFNRPFEFLVNFSNNKLINNTIMLSIITVIPQLIFHDILGRTNLLNTVVETI